MAPSLQATGQINGVWHGRREVVHCFGLWMDQAPELKARPSGDCGSTFRIAGNLRPNASDGPVAVYVKQRGQEAG